MIDKKIYEEAMTKYNDGGYSLRDLEKMYKCCRKTLSKMLKENSSPIRNHKISLTQEIEIISYYNSGKSVNWIAKLYNSSQENVSNILKNNNITVSKSKIKESEKQHIIEDYKLGLYCRELSEKYGINKSVINRLIKKSKIDIHKYRKYTLNEHYFDKIDNEEKAYFLGFLYADGCNLENRNTIQISLQEEDKLILEKFNLLIDSNKELEYIDYSIKQPKWKNQWKLTFSSKHISQQLVKLGCFARKSLTLEFPTEEQVPAHLTRHFIRGYFDGDGCICITKNLLHCSLTSTIEFCTKLRNILDSTLEIYSGIFQPKYSKLSGSSTRLLSIGGSKSSLKFASWIYDDSTIYLERKYNKYINMKYPDTI